MSRYDNEITSTSFAFSNILGNNSFRQSNLNDKYLFRLKSR